MAPNGITSRQSNFLAVLSSGQTITRAASIARVSKRTSARWMKDPAIRAELARLLDDALAQASHKAASIAVDALAVLADIFNDATMPPGARVAAARAALDSGLKLDERQNLAERLTELERRQNER